MTATAQRFLTRADWLPVRLSEHELAVARLVGEKRHSECANFSTRQMNRAGADDSTLLAQDIVGASAEIAVARATGGSWTAVLGPHAPDSLFYEVRARDLALVTEKTNRDLIIRKRDADERRFALCFVALPIVYCVGWILGADGKRPFFFKQTQNGAAAWFVPWTHLRPMPGDSTPAAWRESDRSRGEDRRHVDVEAQLIDAGVVTPSVCPKTRIQESPARGER